MREILREMPRQFKMCAYVSLALLIVVILVVGFVKDWAFAGECAIVGGFSVAILCAYVVWTASVIVREKSHMQSDDREIAEEAGTRTVRKIQIGSFVKTFILAVFLIICVVLFHINAIAAIIGVSVSIVPMIAVPLFVKPEPEETDPEDSEVENNV